MESFLFPEPHEDAIEIMLREDEPLPMNLPVPVEVMEIGFGFDVPCHFHLLDHVHEWVRILDLGEPLIDIPRLAYLVDLPEP